jgi:hypothetical protein
MNGPFNIGTHNIYTSKYFVPGYGFSNASGPPEGGLGLGKYGNP